VCRHVAVYLYNKEIKRHLDGSVGIVTKLRDGRPKNRGLIFVEGNRFPSL
jgi:hypothetical protein